MRNPVDDDFPFYNNEEERQTHIKDDRQRRRMITTQENREKRERQKRINQIYEDVYDFASVYNDGALYGGVELSDMTETLTQFARIPAVLLAYSPVDILQAGMFFQMMPQFVEGEK